METELSDDDDDDDYDNNDDLGQSPELLKLYISEQCSLSLLDVSQVCILVDLSMSLDGLPPFDI
jgi:hypothetical protein